MRRAFLLLVAGCLCLGEAWAQSGQGKPRVPPGRDPGGVAIAVVGARVDYTKPDIFRRLARDGEGELIGWDLIDRDPFPFEASTVPAAGVPPAAGTALARIVLGEASAARLIPLRIPDHNPLAVAGAVAFLQKTPARAALLLIGSAAQDDTNAFAEIFRSAQDLLLIVPAGHLGSDADMTSPKLSRLGLRHAIAVTASEPSGHIPADVTWGAKTVDIAVSVPAEFNAQGLERGAAMENVASARVAALAARLAAAEPGLKGAALKERILSFAKPLPGRPARLTSSGWIADIEGIHSSK